jgi:hypothetical protein
MQKKANNTALTSLLWDPQRKVLNHCTPGNLQPWITLSHLKVKIFISKFWFSNL